MTFEQTLQQGLAHHGAGRRQEAEVFYRQALSMEPASHAAMFMLGALLIETQKLGEALDLLTRATELAPSVPEYRNALGTALMNANRLPEAVASFARAIELRPQYAQAQLGLGRSRVRLGRSKEAAAALQLAVSLRPNDAEAQAELANALREIGQMEAALAAASRAVELDGNYAWGQNILGLIRHDRGEYPLALAALRRAISLSPALSEAYMNLANVHRSVGQLTESMEKLKQAAALAPRDPRPHHNLGVVLAEIGLADEAIGRFRTALSLQPSFAHAGSALLLTMNYHASFTPRQRFEAHLTWGRRQKPPDIAQRRPASPGRLRVGYVSGDFCFHPVSYFIEPILREHDRRRFEVICYSDVARPDAMTHRLRAAADVWRETAGIGHVALAEMIRQDGIDILVDLAGHTRNNRLAVFAARAAGVQVTYLGYPNTTGLSTMDYRLTDAVADPPGEADELHTEKLIRLPRGFLCYQPPAEAEEVSPPPCERRGGGITFGSFNNLAKLTDEAIEVWARLLSSVAGSRLMLKNGALADAQVAARISAAFSRHGVDARRLELRGPTAGVAEHLRIYAQMDIALDTFPYNGTTTTCEALWMGVPVVTFAGESHAGRVGASILSRVGLGELVGRGIEDYVRLALELAADRTRLVGMREGMRGRLETSALLDGKGLTRDIEAAFEGMVRN